MTTYEQGAQDLWQRATSQDALQTAWEQVSSNQGSAGGDLVSIKEFRQNLYANIVQLRAEVLGGSYRTGPFRKVAIPKRKPGYRVLTIPSIRDRILHKSIAIVLTPLFENAFEDSSFAYRPNRGVLDAVKQIERWRKRGFQTVIEADIVSYFDNVNHEILVEKIDALISVMDGAPALISLIKDILVAQGEALATKGIGLVQGSPLSPLLANLYLDALDEEIEAQGVKIVRYADDFVILCKSHNKAQKVLNHCTEVLAEHGLRLHDDGTKIVSFEKGFDFVGYLFVKCLSVKEKQTSNQRLSSKPIKSEITDEGIIELEDKGARFDPGKRVLHLLDPSHKLEVRNRSFSICREADQELIAIPHKRVGRIEIAPHVAFSSSTIELAIDTKTPFHFVDAFGQTRGLVNSPQRRSAGLQFQQAAMILDDELWMPIVKRIVEARIRNQRIQLQRLNRTRNVAKIDQALAEMKRNLKKLIDCKTLKEAFGFEGASSRIYWPCLSIAFDDPKLQFNKRSRPGRDPANTAINYLTGILERDIRAVIQQSGLHAGFGFLHASRDRHDGLVYDLMEPFRAALTEGIAVFLFNARRLKYDEFDQNNAGEILLNKSGRRALVEGYETAAARRIGKPDGTGKLSWRAMMMWQANKLANTIRTNDPSQFQAYLMDG